jgi:hypothetical protein
MKILFSIFALISVSVISIAAVNSREHIRLTFDETTICLPKDYAPGLSPFGQYLQDNVKGLDDSGQSQIIRLPAKLIMEGVDGYSFSHINKYNVDLEHTVSGVANGMSEVTGTPELYMLCEDEYDLGYCYQRVVYKGIFYQYSLKTVEAKNKEKVREYLYTLFKRWESNCGNG